MLSCRDGTKGPDLDSVDVVKQRWNDKCERPKPIRNAQSPRCLSGRRAHLRTLIAGRTRSSASCVPSCAAACTGVASCFRRSRA